MNTCFLLVEMTQDERWNIRYQEVMDFIETNHRNPSIILPGDILPGDRYLAAIGARLLLPGTSYLCIRL